MEIGLISREDLVEKMDRGDDFKLVNVLGDWAFKAKHIPGSINLSTPARADELLVKDDDIIDSLVKTPRQVVGQES